MRQINLIPKDVIEKAEQTKREISLIISIGGTLAVIGCVYVMLVISLAFARGDLGQLQARFPGVAQVSPEGELAQAEDQLTRLYAASPEVAPFLMDHEVYTNLLKAISQAVEGRVWLKSMTIHATDKECQLTGSAFTQEAVSDFVVALKELPFFSQVELVSLEQAPQGESTTLTQFETRCLLAIQ